MRKSASKPSLRSSLIASDPNIRRSIGGDAEIRTAKSLKARLTPGSGAFREKSDGETEDGRYRFENKATEKESFSVKREWLSKITREARARDQCPLLTFQFVDGKKVRPFGAWVCLPESEFRRLVKLLYG